jgi:hypothetical protein
LPNPFKKIQEYDRLVTELEETKRRLAEVSRELEVAREELRKTTGQLDHAQEKAKEERRRRADEEARRGGVEKQLSDAQKDIENLEKELQTSRELAAEPERIAVLDREDDLQPDGILEFLHETDFEPGQPCHTVAVVPGELEGYLETVPGMGPWIPRVAKGEKGIFVFIAGRRACILEPPIPVGTGYNLVDEGFDFTVLEEHLKKPLVGFMSVHRDSYAFGILDTKIRKSTFEEKDALGKTKKGGFSQARYSRSREDQFKHLLSEATQLAGKLFDNSDVEYIFVEGDERAMSALSKHEGISEGRRIVRFTVPGKMGKQLQGRLPDFIWGWRAWAFVLPGSVD